MNTISHGQRFGCGMTIITWRHESTKWFGEDDSLLILNNNQFPTNRITRIPNEHKKCGAPRLREGCSDDDQDSQYFRPSPTVRVRRHSVCRKGRRALRTALGF